MPVHGEREHAEAERLDRHQGERSGRRGDVRGDLGQRHRAVRCRSGVERAIDRPLLLRRDDERERQGGAAELRPVIDCTRHHTAYLIDGEVEHVASLIRDRDPCCQHERLDLIERHVAEQDVGGCCLVNAHELRSLADARRGLPPLVFTREIERDLQPVVGWLRRRRGGRGSRAHLARFDRGGRRVGVARDQCDRADRGNEE